MLAKASISKSLANAARHYAVAKSKRELQRLLGIRQIEAHSNKLRGRRLAASNAWQAWELELLGKYTDKDVARRTGRTRPSIFHKRHRLRIPTVPSLRPWTTQELALLGKVPDKEIARRIGRPYKTVHGKRVALGIPNTAGMLRDWTKAEDKLWAHCLTARQSAA